MGWDRVDVDVDGAGSLVWFGGVLYDVARGWRRADEREDRPVGWGPFGDFDTATVAPTGDLVALVDSDGTKSLLLEPGGGVVREVNRSWDCAEAFRYPLALFTLPDGRTGLVHCPDHVNRIEIEVAATGERLTRQQHRNSPDVFHSRLQVNTAGTRLLSAGWVWHPMAVAAVFDLDAALEDASLLDREVLSRDPGDRFGSSLNAEVAGACFVGDHVVVATTAESLGREGGLGPLALACWSAAEDRYLWRRPAPADLGDLISFHGHVLALNGYPRLFDGRTGDLVHEWPDVPIAATAGPLFVGENSRAGAAMIAVDPDTPRFAIAQPDRITVITHTTE